MSIIDNVEVGKRIKQIRTEYFEKKLTQTEFGQLIDSAVKKSSVRDWENGNNLPNKERLKKIANIANVSVDYILFGKKINVRIFVR